MKLYGKNKNAYQLINTLVNAALVRMTMEDIKALCEYHNITIDEAMKIVFENLSERDDIV